MTVFLVGLFVLAMIAMGVVGMLRTKSLNDFFLGGRTLGPWVSAMTYGTSYFSAVIFIGFAGKLGWGFGLNVLWIALGNAFFGALLAWLVLGRRTRRMTQNLDVMTMPEFFSDRFELRYVKMITAAIIFVFLLPYSASVFKGLGHLFEVNFNISYNTALLSMTLITGIYLILGGYFAIAMTDCIQGAIMLIGSVAMVAVLVGKAGGFTESIQSIMINYPQHVPVAKQPGGLLLLSLVFMTSFGTWGLPQMVQKFYAIKEEKMIVRAALVTTVFALVIGLAAYFCGSLCHAFFDSVPMVNGHPAFDNLIPDLMTQYLPKPLMILILLLVLSASMSTLSSLVLVASSAIAIDMYKGHVNPDISKNNSVAMMRFLSGIFILSSYLIAQQQFVFIVTLMSLSWGAVAGSFMAPFMYGLFWKRTTGSAVMAGILTGLSTQLILFFYWGPAKSPMAASLAMILPFFVIPVVSMFTKPPSQEVIDRAFS
ncbi:MAG: sodium transporter [Spartobacteria bacterium]|nr:sodium transporter [Spartobacteria bacterium]